jgi:hypothetical protein
MFGFERLRLAKGLSSVSESSDSGSVDEAGGAGCIVRFFLEGPGHVQHQIQTESKMVQ